MRRYLAIFAILMGIAAVCAARQPMNLAFVSTGKYSIRIVPTSRGPVRLDTPGQYTRRDGWKILSLLKPVEGGE